MNGDNCGNGSDEHSVNAYGASQLTFSYIFVTNLCSVINIK